MKQCPNCGAEVIRRSAKGQAPRFCQPKCKTEFQARAAVEGRAIIALAKAWRASRNRVEDRELGSKCLGEMVAILDSFNAKDRAAGRPRPTEYARRLLFDGRYIDRMRP